MPPSSLVTSKFSWPVLGIAGAFAAGGIFATVALSLKKEGSREETQLNTTLGYQEGAHFTNWSNTHEVSPRRLYEPETVDELKKIVAEAHEKGEGLRCVGSALSPNGIAFSEEGMVSLALLDKILEVDTAAGRIQVQAGARVQQVVEALRPHGLTLQNFASIREQSIGGFTQVSAHGTGGAIPPVDEQVVGLKLVTPAEGELELSETRQPELFRLAKVGLGLLGVVSELTLQCHPAHTLLEHTYVATEQVVRRNHAKLLRENRHVKYLWIPYTDAVVVVTNNPVPKDAKIPASKGKKLSEVEKTEPFRRLLLEVLGGSSEEDLKSLSGPQLRDRLLERNPMDVNWVKRVNQAEAEFWRRSEGYRLGASDELLGFDCGGQQWVLEVCLPTGTLKKPSGADLQFMRDLRSLLERRAVPAPAPIEQRWSSASSADLSPASSPGLDGLHSWVGIIMYLPEADSSSRQLITNSFNKYAQAVETELLPKYGAVPHWAKLEVDRMGKDNARKLLQQRYPADKLAAARNKLDPKNILSNTMLDAVFPKTITSYE